MKLRILSDLHNEFFRASDPPKIGGKGADVIILAGDISKGARGIAWARQEWPDKEIIFVPGNHEYYGSDIKREDSEMRWAGREYNVHVLNPGTVDIGGVRFIGATLWTDFKLFGQAEGMMEHVMIEAMNSLADFRVIDFEGRTFSPSDSIALHERDLHFIRQALYRKFEGKTVVITHHLPSMLSVAERFKKDPICACFASNLDDLVRSDLWIHGHTHDSFDYQHPRGARVVCNPRGYPTSWHGYEGIENSGFKHDFVVEILSTFTHMSPIEYTSGEPS